MRPLDEMLLMVAAAGGSDLHLVAGDPPRMRVNGDLVTLDEECLEAQATLDVLHQIMLPRQREVFEQESNVDFAHEREDQGRFRVNVFRHLYGVGAVFRLIPSTAQSLESLNVPPVVKTLCMQKQGLVLVTGKTGSGKSTTLAAMIDAINQSHKGHIVTIEDPIEFEHSRVRCLISQREVGEHTRSFASALRSALREDPDVILVGELRDIETMSLAVTAAETGILVLGTLHTNNAASTVDRMINAFPATKQPQIRSMLSTSLRGVVSQQLLRRQDGQGRLCAIEVLVNTPAVGNLIREGKTEQLENIIQGGAQAGMQSMDNAIRQLLDQKLISRAEGFEAAHDKSQFEQHSRDAV